MDPILVSVIDRALAAVTEEMGLTLLRTTRSPIFSEARDFVTGIYDAKGRMLAQMEYIPILAFAIPPALKHLIKFFGDDIAPDDVFVQNDVYSGGNQSADVAVFKPVFHEGKLLFWVASKGHHADLGGGAVGGYNPRARDVWQESFRIPPLKVIEKGRRRDDVWNLLMTNTRLPGIVGGDMEAQIGACTVGERRMQALINRYGEGQLLDLIEDLIASTEQRVRKEIARIPSGVYRGTATLDHDAVQKDKLLKVQVTVTVDGERIKFDFTGTDPQVPSYVNATLAATQSVTLLSFLMLINPDIPHNEGLVAPTELVVPEGCLLNAKAPAPSACGNFTCSDAIPEAIFQALAEALPDRVTAGWQRFFGGPIAGIDPRSGRYYVDTTFFSGKGGGGATQDNDGWSHIGLIGCAGGLRAQDYEMHEIQTPHVVLEHEFWSDSAGAGEWRGGFGVHTRLRTYAKNPIHNLHGDGSKPETRPYGLLGGKPGAMNRCLFHFPDGTVLDADLKDNYDLQSGTIVESYAAGGGGFGDPLRRDPAKVLEDVQNGLISVENARADYAVVINPHTLELDLPATSVARGRA